MSNHADNYGLPWAFGTIALFGASGQIGDRILNALVSSKHKDFNILAIVPPGAESQVWKLVTVKPSVSKKSRVSSSPKT